jgi:hypothetical protein
MVSGCRGKGLAKFTMGKPMAFGYSNLSGAKSFTGSKAVTDTEFRRSADASENFR